jgi:hypothetical protein
MEWVNWIIIPLVIFVCLLIFWTSDKVASATPLTAQTIQLGAFVGIFFAATILVVQLSDENLHHFVKKHMPGKRKRTMGVATEDITEPVGAAADPTLHVPDAAENHAINFTEETDPNGADCAETNVDNTFDPNYVKDTVRHEMKQRFHNGLGGRIRHTLDSRENFVKEMNAGRLRKDKYMKEI